MKKTLLGLLTLIICLVYFLILASFINHRPRPEIDLTSIQSFFYVPIQYFRPEPQERSLFLAAVLSIPILGSAVYLLLSFHFLKIRQKIINKTVYRILNLSTVLGIGVLAWLGLNRSEFGYLRVSTLALAPGLTLLFNGLMFALIFLVGSRLFKRSRPFKKLIKWAYFSLGLALIGLLSAETIFNEQEPYTGLIHFVAYFDSVAQVYLGNTLFVDFSSQYGAYALLLSPLFRIIGLNVLKFTLVMGILKALVYFCLLFLLWKLTENKLIALMGFASLIFYTRMRALLDIFDDPYFQYNPHRMIFPIFFIFLLWFYLTTTSPRGKKYLYGAITLLASVSILWNPDTGFVVMATWLIFLGYQELLLLNQVKLTAIAAQYLKHLMVSLGCLLVCFAALYFYTYGSSGYPPNILEAAEYTNLFYFYGYYMLPMPAIHPWNMVILLYAAGLFWSVADLIDKSIYPGTRLLQNRESPALIGIIFAISILGVGLFNYYVGRSHDLSLIAPSWPIFILITIYADQLLSQLSALLYSRSSGLKTRLGVAFLKDFKAAAFLSLVYFMSASLLSILVAMPTYLNVIATRWAGVIEGPPDSLQIQADFIRSTSEPANQVFILSDFAPALYLSTEHSRPVAVAGFGEIIMRKDWDTIQLFLANPPRGAKIYWDPKFKIINPFDFPNLDPAASTRHNEMILFEDQKP